jgi:protocatechuate 3,4-dioxygenase beta subunit
MKFITILLSSVLASAQPASTKKPATIEGVATNSVNFEAVKKAIIMLENVATRSGYMEMTDVAGHFRFENVAPGSYRISAVRDRFTRSNGKPLQVDEEQQIKDLSIKLIPLAAVSGHVFDEDGDPIAAARIQVVRNTYAQGRRQLIPGESVSTNDLGEFQFINLEPGRYYFQANIPSRIPYWSVSVRSVRPEESYPVTFYPSAQQVEQATAVEVSPGADINSIDFRARQMRSYHIRGKIVDAAGQTGGYLPVSMRMGGSVVSSGKVQADGTFDVPRVVPGSYIASTQWSDGLKIRFVRQPVSVSDQDVNGVVLTLAPALEISGGLQVEGKQLDKQLRSLLTLQPVTKAAPATRVSPESDGTFVLHNLAPEVYELSVTVFPGTYLKAIKLGDQDITGTLLDLTKYDGGSLKLLLGTDGGKLDGTVQDQNGDPASGVLITIAPPEGYESRHDSFRQTLTDEKGDFHAADLAPGDYKVFAWQQADESLVQAAEFRKLFQSKAASVSIAANGHASVQLKIIPATDIEKEKSRLP